MGKAIVRILEKLQTSFPGSQDQAGFPSGKMQQGKAKRSKAIVQ
jgi:hypothetical protein